MVGWVVSLKAHFNHNNFKEHFFFFFSHFQIVTLYISISSRPQTPDSWVGSPFNQCMSDPTAVPVVLLQLYFKRLPVVTHVFSKETGFAKHKLLTHAQSRFSPSQHWAVITDWMKHPEKGIKKKKILKGAWSSQLHPVAAVWTSSQGLSFLLYPPRTIKAVKSGVT